MQPIDQPHTRLVDPPPLIVINQIFKEQKIFLRLADHYASTIRRTTLRVVITLHRRTTLRVVITRAINAQL